MAKAQKVYKDVAMTGGSFRLVNPGRIYLDQKSGKTYTGDKTWTTKHFSAYERSNMAKNKEEAITRGKIFYLVETPVSTSSKKRK
jgi:hypothetical protein